MKLRTSLAPLALAALFASMQAAAAGRTYVASTGIDSNPCSLALPCRSFAAALTQTDAGGEVIALDSAGYGTVVIGKSVSIVAPPGIYAGITATTSHAIVIAAGPSDVVVLRGLTLNHVGHTGTYGHMGIALAQPLDALHVEDCVINGFEDGIIAGNSVRLFVRDSIVRGAYSAVGVYYGASASIDRTRFDNNGIGVQVQFAGSATVSNSVASGNAHDGFTAYNGGGSGTAELSVESSVASGNAQCGVSAVDVGEGGKGIVRVAGSTVVDNACGLWEGFPIGWSVLESTGTSLVRGNGVDLRGTITTIPRI